MAVLELSDDTIEEVVQSADTPVLIEFMADWCQPCAALGPVLDQLASEHEDRLVVAKIDVGVHRAASVRHQVMGTPTLVLFVDGEPRARMLGARGKAQLTQELADWL
jgi:thioredoxin 1